MVYDKERLLGSYMQELFKERFNLDFNKESRNYLTGQLTQICTERAEGKLNKTEVQDWINHLRPMISTHPETFLKWMRENNLKNSKKEARKYHTVMLILNQIKEDLELSISPRL